VGTSRNVSSPSTPEWKLTGAVIGRNDVSVERQALEVWRSAYADRGSRLIDDFSHPTLAVACSLAARSSDVSSALRQYDSLLNADHRVGFAAEVGRRALARAIVGSLGSEGFARELFAEATSYYASRDLCSFVGSPGRVESTTKAIALKNAMKDSARVIVAKHRMGAVSPDSWAKYVTAAVDSLRGGRR
jgi:hypothetical protein